MKDAHPDQEVEVWFQDEARIGQQGTLTNVWAEKGSRPVAVKQTEYEWAYLFGAACPRTGASSARIAPTVNTDYMNVHLEFISQKVGPDKHAVLVMDRAGWHLAKALKAPANLTLPHLPPSSPERSAMARVWLCLRGHYLSNRADQDYDEIFEALQRAWNALDEARFRSLCHEAWIGRAA